MKLPSAISKPIFKKEVKCQRDGGKFQWNSVYGVYNCSKCYGQLWLRQLKNGTPEFYTTP